MRAFECGAMATCAIRIGLGVVMVDRNAALVRSGFAMPDGDWPSKRFLERSRQLRSLRCLIRCSVPARH